jgi:hypothetical protein
MNFLADESVDQPIVERLRQDGHRVMAIADLAPGVDDHVVLSMADREGALLLTADQGLWRTGLPCWTTYTWYSARAFSGTSSSQEGGVRFTGGEGSPNGAAWSFHSGNPWYGSNTSQQSRA